jgi:hypothetical protein
LLIDVYIERLDLGQGQLMGQLFIQMSSEVAHSLVDKQGRSVFVEGRNQELRLSPAHLNDKITVLLGDLRGNPQFYSLP